MKYIRRFITIELFFLCSKIDQKTHHDMMMDYAEKYIKGIGGVFIGQDSLDHFKDEDKKIEELMNNA